MNETQESAFLKTIQGAVLITHNNEDLLCCIEDLQSTKYFSIGQIFHAVRVLNGKTVEDYGNLWPKYRPANGTNPQSNDWQHIAAAYENCESDYDFLVEACNQLKEEVPAIVARKTVEQNISAFKASLSENI